ncbi:MAG: siderophore biosynthesis protein IucC, partial [Oligoflexia bacterium]|nr:siderophore biosynthesis protein IucC [Oligoflexia bacterium]
WVAVLKNDAIHDELSASEMSSFYENELGTSLYYLFLDTVKNLGKNPSDYLYLPVHPWQWDKIIQIQFLDNILNESIVDLGVQGDFYSPQISIRTLSNVSNPKRSNLKLPLSILNTSAVRGISSRYIGIAVKVASELSDICEQDFFLKKSNTLVLEDKIGISVQQQEYAKIAEAPYRYKETLGAIWRESSNVKINIDEKAILTASLFHQDLSGRSLIGEYIRRSGITTDEWLSLYFSHVVLPLYHLQLKYGLGLVAHGQNIVLRLKNYKPSGLLLKDFQGDLRVNAEILKNKYPKGHVFYHLDQLPSHYLIHDLITGHFVTVLRFVSEVLQESDNYSENKFYSLLEKSLKDYMKEHCHTEVDLKVNLLKEKVERVLLNKVRFKIGYGDSSERPLPALGTELNNPISYRGVYESKI